MNYKPYSTEWNRRRYLSEAIQTYFNDDVEPSIVVDDILDILSEQVSFHASRAKNLQEILDNLK
jgi:hypothetical protein